MLRFAMLAAAVLFVSSPAGAGFCRDRAGEAQFVNLEIKRLLQLQHNSQQAMMRARTRISRLRSREIRYDCGIAPKPGYGAECRLIADEIVDLRAEILAERSRRDLRGVRIRDFEARYAGLAAPFREGGQCVHGPDAPAAVRCGPDGTGVIVTAARIVPAPDAETIAHPRDPLDCVLTCYAREGCRRVDYALEAKVCLFSDGADDAAGGDAVAVTRYTLCD